MKTALTHFAVAVVVFVLTLAVYGFLYAAVANKSAAVAGLDERIQAKVETSHRIASARAALADISDNETTMRGYFVSESDVVAFINDLEARGRLQNASVTVLSVSTASENAHSALTIALTIKGTFEAVMRTLGSVEYAPYYLRIGTLSLGLDTPAGGKSASNGKNSWHADLSIIVGSTAPPVAQ